MRVTSPRLACFARACVVGLGCGSDPDDSDPTSTVTMTTQADPTTGGETTGAATTAPASTSTGTDSSSGDPDVTGLATTGGGLQPCDPAMAPFLGAAPALPQASIAFDLGIQTCAAASMSGEAPQIVLDVQPSGLIDATIFGFEIVSVSSGQPFDDPPTGDSEVIDLNVDLAITFELTAVADGQPVTIAFEIFSTGPTLIEVAAEFG